MVKRVADEMSGDTSDRCPITPQKPYSNSGPMPDIAKRARTETYQPEFDQTTPCPLPATGRFFSPEHSPIPPTATDFNPSHLSHPFRSLSLPTSPSSSTRFHSSHSASPDTFIGTSSSTKVFYSDGPSSPTHSDDAMEIDECSLDFAALDLAAPHPGLLAPTGTDSDHGRRDTPSRHMRAVRWASLSSTSSLEDDTQQQRFRSPYLFSRPRASRDDRMASLAGNDENVEPSDPNSVGLARPPRNYRYEYVNRESPSHSTAREAGRGRGLAKARNCPSLRM